MASYPSAIVSTAVFTVKANTLDIIDASHPNLIQEEIIAIQTALGTNPALSSNGTGTHVPTSTPFGTVAARLNNLEIGILGDVHTQYIRKTADAGNIIAAPSAGTIKGLIIKGGSSQSVSLQEWQNSTGTALAKVDELGNITAAAVTATSFVKTGGTASQFLKADGSVDSSSYSKAFSVNTTAKTAAYTLATTDYDTMLQMNGAFAFSLTTALSSAPVGTQIHFLALTTGASVSATGVTLNSASGLKLRAAYSSATLICKGTNDWVLVGDLSA